MNLIGLASLIDRDSLAEITTKGAKFFSMQFNLFASQKKKDKLYNELLESLSERAFLQLGPVLVMQLQLSKGRAEKFANSEEQADAYIAKRPKMIAYRDLTIERMREFRQKCKLPV